MDKVHQLDSSRMLQMARRHRRELLLLRFEPESERRFARENDQTRQGSRAWFLLAGIALITSILCIDYIMHEVPADYMAMRVGIAAKLLIPTLMISLLLTTYFPRTAETAIALSVSICAFAMLYERHLAIDWGIHIPPAFAFLPLFVGTLLCRVRWLPMLPLQIAVLGMGIWLETLLDQPREARLSSIYAMSLLIFATITGGWMIEFFNRLTWLRRDWLARISSFDPLTGLLNKRAFHKELQQRLDYAQRKRRPIALVIIDVDHFKAYNDNYGHQAGDRCLATLAEKLGKAAKRGGDLAARIGGEEFALLWFGLDRISTNMLLARLLETVRELNIAHNHTGTNTSRITISAGACWLVPSDESTLDQLLHSADMLMYEAKNAGRDQFRLR